MIHKESYNESMGPDMDYLALCFELRSKGGELAEAASRSVMTWDGDHRLCLAISEWYKTIANEKTYKKETK